MPLQAKEAKAVAKVWDNKQAISGASTIRAFAGAFCRLIFGNGERHFLKLKGLICTRS
jgi:hypothetical protein